MANKKTLVRFNVQNVKYAVPTAQGSFGAFQDMGTSMKLALENDSSVKKIYGDGRRIVHIVNEKGKTATLTQNNVCDAYEVAMGRKIKTKQGLADIKQVKNISHVIYFETCGIDEDGATVLAKTMLYGVTSTPPSLSTKLPTILTSRLSTPHSKSAVLRFWRQTVKSISTTRETKLLFGK